MSTTTLPPIEPTAVAELVPGAQRDGSRRRPVGAAAVSSAGRPLYANRERATEVADVVRALGHPVRLCIVARLCAGEAYVGQLARDLGAPQAVISQQLRILRMHGLVAVSRSNSHAYYRLAEPRLRDFVGCIEGLS